MRRPAQIKEWMDIQELAMWVRKAPDKDSYKRRLAIWLTQSGHFAHQVATMLQISVPSVWQWIKQFNQRGPEGLERKGRGGRRWSFLSGTEEENLLRSFTERAVKGEILTVKQMLPEVQKVVGKKVSLDYVYRLFYRHGWRKLGPRPHHVKRDKEKQEDFKKTFRK